MRVFMLGWEFPPHISGGLGTACYGLTKGLVENGVQVFFVLPTAVAVGGSSHVQIRTPANLGTEGAKGAETAEGIEDAGSGAGQAAYAMPQMQVVQVDAALQPYAPPGQIFQAAGTIRSIAEKPRRTRRSKPIAAAATPVPAAAPPAGSSKRVSTGLITAGGGAHYQGDLMGQVNRYARQAVELARREEFDLIHAHDWMTYPAGMAVKAATGKPLVVHVHSTEFDRSGESVNQQVYDIERAGMHAADRVVCVSYLTRSLCITRYGVPPEKVDVVYNAVEIPNGQFPLRPIRQNEKIVLFLGRVTMQKGPEYFLRAARKVVDRFKSVRFVMAGSGDMITQCIRQAAELHLGRYVTFTGFLRGLDVDRVFAMADLYVMPSVSEPFGIAPLEALSRNVPAIISKQSGVSEVLRHVLKVDFWDVDEIANKILAVLRHPPLQRTLRHHGAIELRKMSWKDSAARLKAIYHTVCGPPGRG